MKKILLILLIVMNLQADMLSKGSTSIGVTLGGASINNENYTIAGVIGKYFVIDDLSIGLGYEKWFSGNPDISKITAETTYYLKLNEEFRPYAGLLYRRVFISGDRPLSGSYNDTNAYGYRIGLAMIQDNLLISFGIVQEKYDTKQNLFDDTQTYAELTIGFSF
jgi:hypothetical protein